MKNETIDSLTRVLKYPMNDQLDDLYDLIVELKSRIDRIQTDNLYLSEQE